MSDQKSAYKNRRLPGGIFTLAYTVIFPALFILVLLFQKGEIHQVMNRFHTPFLDHLMRLWTALGDGLILPLLLLVLLFTSLRLFFTSILAYLLGGVSVQILKRLIFADFPRPAKYFELYPAQDDIYFVPGVDLYTWLSFPSGHTTVAFAVAFACALSVKSNITRGILFILALGVGYSRIYLSQHFLMDVVAGSFLGIVTGMLAYRWTLVYKKSWLDSPLIGFKK